VERALSILELFDERTERLNATQVAAALGVHRSTASRLLATLERHRLVEADREAGGYVLGLGLVSLAGHVFNRFPVWSSGRGVVRELRNATGETTWLGVLDGDEVVYIDQASGPNVRVHADWVGRRQTLTAAVTGALLLAYQEPEVIKELLLAGKSDGEPAAQHLSAEELATIRARGNLARYEDPSSGHAVVAAPVRDHRGTVVAALSLSGLRDRIGPQRFTEELVPATCRAASRIAEGLGHPSSHTVGPGQA
jgi:DNA-binding IclR family transcriptional regulator